MESYGFIDAKHPKYVSTVKAIERELSNDGLLYRYKNQDDFALPSLLPSVPFGSSIACTKCGRKRQYNSLKTYPTAIIWDCSVRTRF